MSSRIVPVETDFLSNPTAAQALTGNPERAYLQIQNKDSGPITYKFGSPIAENVSPFIVAASAEQQLVFNAVPTGGTWTISFTTPAGFPTGTGTYTTTALAYNANASAVQTALQALGNIGNNNIAVAGGYTSASPMTFTFEGQLANMAVPDLVANVGALTNNLVQSNAVQAINFSEPPTAGNFTLGFGANSTPSMPYNISTTTLETYLNALDSVAGGVSALSQDGTSKDFSVTMGNAPLANAPQPLITVQASTLTGSANEASAVWTLACATEPITGTFILGDTSGNVTTALQWNVTAAQIATALAALPTIGAGNVAVTGTNLVGGFSIALQGAMANTPFTLLIVPNAVDGMNLTQLQSDTLEADDITAGLDEIDPEDVKLSLVLNTPGHGLDTITITVATTVAGGAPGPVSAAWSLITAGQAAVNDGTIIDANGAPALFDTAVPIESLWIKSQNTNAAVTILQG